MTATTDRHPTVVVVDEMFELMRSDAATVLDPRVTNIVSKLAAEGRSAMYSLVPMLSRPDVTYVR